ncbi:hypothetical protein BD560DRAFT_396002 [Blakeslea trispora]|nr:hypothetical protein BD560DRAFT_396002 [Blakeslea trispora]
MTTHAKAMNEHKIFVGNLSFKTTKASLTSFASTLGNVVRVKMIKHHGRSLGYGFISFESEKEAEKAVKELDKKILDGRELNVQLAMPEPSPELSLGMHQIQASTLDTKESSKKAKNPKKKKNKNVQKPEEKKASRTPSKTMLFIANLPYATTDQDLIKIFGNYQLVSAHVARMNNGRSKGYGFVELENEEAQQKAVESVKDLTLEGRSIYIKVALSAEQARTEQV